MRAILALLLALVPGVSDFPAGPQVPANPAEVSASRLEQRLRGLRTLRADFEQTYRPASQASPLTEKGRFFFQRPDSMRWEYTEPEVKVFVHREGVFEQYYPDDNQLIRARISPGDSGAEILSLLSGAKKLADDYALELEGGAGGGQNQVRLTLTPRREGEFSRIVLEVNGSTSLLDGAHFFDFAGNVTEFKFRGARPDARLPAGIFKIKVPRDCEVIDDLSPGRS